MDKEGILRKVRALLDRADHPNTPVPEAEQSRLKADQLMAAYAIEAFMVDDARRKAGQSVLYKPEVRTFTRDYISQDSEVNSALFSLWVSLVNHVGARAAYSGSTKLKVVGFPADLDYLDLMYTSIRMFMSGKLVPTPDPTLSDGENVAKMKEAGYKWDKIYELMGSSLYDKRGKKRTHLFNAYKRYCKDHGIQHVGIHPDLYLRSFVSGFTNEVVERLLRMRSNRENDARTTTGAAVALRGRKDLVNELFYEIFPNLRPHPTDCQCSRCNPPKSNRPVRYRKMSSSAIDYSTYKAGKRAGSQVDLSGGRGVAPRRREVEG